MSLPAGNTQEEIANVGRQHAVQVLHGCSVEMGIMACYAPVGNAQRLPGERERENMEQVLERAAGQLGRPEERRSAVALRRLLVPIDRGESAGGRQDRQAVVGITYFISTILWVMV